MARTPDNREAARALLEAHLAAQEAKSTFLRQLRSAGQLEVLNEERRAEWRALRARASEAEQAWMRSSGIERG